MLSEPWRTNAVYTDGGCISANPSNIGITWAWCLVQDDQIVASASGVLPASGGLVGNNQAEFYAALLALEALPDGWRGYLCSDSNNTLGRFFREWKCSGIPLAWIARLEQQLARLEQQIIPVLLQGHPTKTDLECGIGAKRGLPVSKHNKWCDERCQEEARKYLEGRRCRSVTRTS